MADVKDTPVKTEASDEAASAAAPAADVTSTSGPDLRNVSLEDAEKLLRGEDVEVPVLGGGEGEKKEGEVEPEKTEKVEPEKTEKVEPEPEPEKVEAVVEDEPVVEDDDKKKTRDETRIRFKDPKSRAVAVIFKAHEDAGTPISWAKAEEMVHGPKAKEETTEEAAERRKETVAAFPEVTEAQTAITALEAEVTDLEKVIDAAGEKEGVFNADIAKVTKDLARKQAELIGARLELKTAQEKAESQLLTRSATEKERETARAKWHNKAVERWPDAADTSTPLGAAVAKRIAEMRDPKHPDNPILYADSAPYRVVSDLAEEMGIAPKTTTPTAKIDAKTAPKKDVLSPASGAKGTVKKEGSPEDALKDKVAHAQSEKATLADVDDVLFGGQKPAVTIR